MGLVQGGFTPTVPYNPVTGSKAVCGSSNVQIGGTTEAAYSAHHEPFQYLRLDLEPPPLPSKLAVYDWIH